MIEQNSELVELIEQITSLCFMDGYLSSAGITSKDAFECTDEEIKVIEEARYLAREYSKMRKLS